MSDLSIALFDKNHAVKLSIPNIQTRVDALVWENLGGPKTASINMTGDWHIDEALNFLGNHVEVFAPNGDCVWWGYIDSVKATQGAIVYGVSFESLANYMIVNYVSESLAVQTYAGIDQNSRDRYGTKERRDTVPLSNEASANQYRAKELAVFGWPITTFQHNPNNVEDFIQLSCKGWYDSLAWRYYNGVTQSQWDREITHHSTLYSEYIGNDVAVTSRAIAQKITMQYTGTIDYVSLNFGWSGQPVGDCNIYLMADGATPGAVGSEFSKSKTDMSIINSFGGYQNYDYKLEPAVSKNKGDIIWLVIDAGLDGGGSFKTWARKNTSGGGFRQDLAGNWTQATGADGFDMDYLIRIITESSVAVADGIAKKGQFIVGSSVPVFGTSTGGNNSKIDQTALAYIGDLMAQGSVNNRRFIPRVDRNRYLRVFEESAGGTSAATLTLSRDGIIRNINGGEEFPTYQDPCGQWCIIKELIPSSSAVRKVDPSIFMIERASYMGSTGGMVITPRGVPSPLEVFTIQRK